MTDGYFLPYQEAWLRDTSRLKIWEKSRRIGATFVQAYEDVVDASRDDKPLDVWFSSADESAAKEYMRYCAMWTQLLNVAADDLGEVVIDRDDDIKALVIEFATKKRIHGLSSNPKAFRSKGGKLVLDEFAFHGDAEALWKAAAPVITWGFPARILSTYNGKGNRYYRMVDEARKGSGWKLHTVTIEDAVAGGLADRIAGRTLSDEERLAFIAECRSIAGDEETYLQEFMCQPVDEATAWLPWNMIISCEHADAGKPELYAGGDAYVGMDIGRRRDLTVIWVIELVGDIPWTREIVRMKKASFAEQDAELDRVFAAYRVRRCCADETGLGMKPVEDAKKRHGEYRVEGVTFTGPVKQHLATIGKQAFEDRRARIPASLDIRNSHHAVRKMTTAAGNVRFDAERTEVGHADEFWAHMLALHAAEDVVQPPAGATIENDPGAYVPKARANDAAGRLLGRPGGVAPIEQGRRQWR
jgi:phage FluMu gp28-like protein